MSAISDCPILPRQIFCTFVALALVGCAGSPVSPQGRDASTTAQAQAEQSSSAQPASVVRYGRYTLVSTAPRADQHDLMSQIIDVTIPDAMQPNVYDAMSYVLKRSGYSLCQAEGNVGVLYALPLPASQYQLGPMTLRSTVQVLAGPAWDVVVDELSRNVCFEQRPGYARVAPAQAAGGSK